MGNASASMQRERHKSSDISTPNSPFRDMSGRDSVVYGVGVGGGSQHAGIGGGGGSVVVGGGGGAAGGGAQAFTFTDTQKTADVSISHGSSQDDEEEPYYTKPVGGSKGDMGGTATPTNATAAADNSTTTTTTAPTDPEFSEAAEPRKRSNTVSEGTIQRSTDSMMSAANESSKEANISSSGSKDDQHAAALGTGALPTVLRWDGGGKNVMISGTFTKWKPIPMVRSHGNFVTIIDLPEGDHQYKFCVDGEWKHDPKLKSIDGEQGETNNLVSVRQSDFEVFQALAKDSENTPNYAEKEYSQEVPQSKPWEKVSGPPVLPPHLLQVILNKDTPLSCEPTLLPEPNHVMLNHLYALSIKDGVMVLSATHRYRKKYVTTLLYKPI